MSAPGNSRYDVVILGTGHNGLVAAAYLARAGLSVLMLEKNDHIGGATVSARIFPDYDARISRYAYLVSLLPDKIIKDLGLNIELRRRKTASFTPYLRNGEHRGLLLSNESAGNNQRAMKDMTGSDVEFQNWQSFYDLTRVFAEKAWDTMLQPLRSRGEFEQLFASDPRAREAWRRFVEEPLGSAVEHYFQNDVMRGAVFTDAKIGLFTHPHDPTLLQNRCFLYHVIGNKTGEWKVPVGGMGQVAGELQRVAVEAGVEIMTGVNLRGLGLWDRPKTIEFESEGQRHSVDSRFVLINFGRNELARMMGMAFEPDATHEGSVFKINMLLKRLPKLAAKSCDAKDAFCGTFHIDESYEQMNWSHTQAEKSKLPNKIPCEVYCHTLTDDSILSPELRAKGFHTLTLFALDTPWRLFEHENERISREATKRCLEGLNRLLAELVEDCLARSSDGKPCIEAKSPVDIEAALGHYRGNIFHGALQFPFAEQPEEEGAWGVETQFPDVFSCGSSVRRGGAVSGIPGHNAAMKVLEAVGQRPQV